MPANWQDTGFSEQQWTALQALINGNAGRQGPPGDKGPPGPSGPSGPAGSSSSNDPNKWNASEIGFFDPHLDKSYGEGEVVTVGRDLYYRSVILFIERIKDLAQIKDVSMIRTNLNTCLRGFALEWYTSELRDLERIGLRADTNGVEAWCRTLKSRFKVRTNVALESLTSERYTLNDARNQREPAAYIQAVLRHAKNANIDSVENQLSFAYRGIAVELRAMVDAPTQRTTVADFIDRLDLKKDVWFDIHRALTKKWKESPLLLWPYYQRNVTPWMMHGESGNLLSMPKSSYEQQSQQKCQRTPRSTSSTMAWTQNSGGISPSLPQGPVSHLRLRNKLCNISAKKTGSSVAACDDVAAP